jgi:hypothetical protein
MNGRFCFSLSKRVTNIADCFTCQKANQCVHDHTHSTDAAVADERLGRPLHELLSFDQGLQLLVWSSSQTW